MLIFRSFLKLIQLLFGYRNDEDLDKDLDNEEDDTNDESPVETPGETPAATPDPSPVASGTDSEKLPWPSAADLNARVRRIVTSYQRKFKKEELKNAQKAKVGIVLD